MNGSSWMGGDAAVGWVVVLLAVCAAVAAAFMERKKNPPPDPQRLLEDSEVVRLKTSGRLVETGRGSRRYRPAKPDRG